MRGSRLWSLDAGLLAGNLVLFGIIKSTDGKLSPAVTLILFTGAAQALLSAGLGARAALRLSRAGPQPRSGWPLLGALALALAGAAAVALGLALFASSANRG